MVSLQQAKTVLDQHWRSLFAYPGVVSVDVTADNGEAIIRICGLVEIERHVEQIPLMIDGVRIAVDICSDPPQELTLPMGGRILTEGSQGTAGCFVANGGRTYLVTVSHLWGKAAQAGSPVRVGQDQIGTLERWVPFEGYVPVDAAAIVLSTTDFAPTIPYVGAPLGIRQAALGDKVWKLGANSGFSTGLVGGLWGKAVYPKTGVIVDNVFTVLGMRTIPGDSGGPVFDEQGMLVGFVSGGNGVTFVADALQVFNAVGLNPGGLLRTDAPFSAPTTTSIDLHGFVLPALVGGLILVGLLKEGK